MKILLFLLLSLFSTISFAQKSSFKPINLSLPGELSYYDNQFSGLYIQNKNLYLLSESRLQDSAEAKIYSILLTDIDKKLIDSNYTLPYKKLPIYNLQLLRQKMKLNNDDYEGLEAIIIQNNKIYLSVETATPSNNCYLIKGIVNDTAVILGSELLTLPKPVDSDGNHIYNAGYESLAFLHNGVAAFFEFNYFNNFNNISFISDWSYSSGKYHPLPIQKIPFRITDITPTTNKKFTAINYFYKGSGKDEVYRVPINDANNKLITDTAGYQNYCRLIEIKEVALHNFKYKTLWEFPKALMSYNWEGLAAYKKGYFVINDKYTPYKPYSTVLLYLQKVK